MMACSDLQPLTVAGDARAATMRFTHRHRGEFAWDPARAYVQDRPWAKPQGFWLSVDGDWERWLEAENMLGEPGWGLETIEFNVDGSRLLHIGTVAEMDEFDTEYVAHHCTNVFMGKPDRYRIDWSPLATQHAGILIAPYIWERRLQGDASSWYYSWDAASAVIWDLSAIEPKAEQT